MGWLYNTAAAAVVAVAAWSQVRLVAQWEKVSPFLMPQRDWKYQHHQIPDLSGQVMIVSGANVGLGAATAKLLLQRGATVVMGCRRMRACEAARDALAPDVPDVTCAVPMHVDLSSLKSVAAFADTVAARFNRLDAVVLNAAVFPPDFRTAPETQLELAFSVNHLGHALLTTRLLHHFEDAMAESTGMKISVVTSSHHFLAYDPPQWTAMAPAGALTNASQFSPNAAYGQSKLANILFAQELSEQLEGRGRKNFYVNSVHPGGVRTNLLADWQKAAAQHLGVPMNWSEWVLDLIAGSILFAPEDAALTPVYTVTSPDVEALEIRGKYFVPIAHTGRRSHQAADPELQRQLWQYTEDLLAKLGHPLRPSS